MARVPLYIGRVKLPLSFDMSISSQAFADSIHFGLAAAGLGGAYAALENPAFNRGVQIISGTIASLPLKTYHYDADGDMREPSSSFLDQDPAGPGRMTPFNWKERIVMHVVTAGEVGLPHVHAESGALIGLIPFGPLTYIPRWENKGTKDTPNFVKVFKVTMADGSQRDFGDGCENAIDGRCMTQILGPSFDGLRGLSPMWLFRNGLALAAALDTAARKTMTSGMHVAGMVSARQGSKVTFEDAESLQKAIKETMSGPEHAGELTVTNGEFDFKPWIQSNVDAQFMEAREFTVHEVARMLGVPAHLLFSTSKEQSFASGLAEQMAAFHRTTLLPITSRIEEAISPLIGPSTKFVAFDYEAILQPTPEVQQKLWLEQLAAGVLSEEEYRDKSGLGPKDPTDTFRTPAPVAVSGRPAVEVPNPAPTDSSGNGKMTNMPASKMAK